MHTLLILIVELAAILLVAVGIGIELGSGWGLVAGGVGVLAEVFAAQMPARGK
jgi:hypothetical protein